MGLRAPRGLAATAVFGLLLCLAAAAGSWALMPESAVHAASRGEKTLPVEIVVHLDGRALSIDTTQSLTAQAEGISRAHLREPLTLVAADGRRLTRSRRSWGGRMDARELTRLLLAAKDPSSLMRRVHARRSPGTALRVPLPFSFDATVAGAELATLKDELDRRPVDARMDVETHAPRPHEDGLTVDVWGSVEAIEAAIAGGAGEVALVAAVTRARRTADELEGVSMNSVLGTFDTHYDASYRSENRSFNLKVAADKINGMVVLPGETFDFNGIVGERSEANGFRVAPVIAAGQVVDGVGGGTCQVSGTLHGAVFFAGLAVTDRQPHSRPSGYIKLGLDAMVSYPNMNFQFANNREFPVVVGFTVTGGIARATLWGASHDLQVTFVRRVDETTPFPERDVDDAELPRGVRVLSQRGVPGFELTRWRIIRDVNTRQAVRERLEDAYPPTTQIWRVGTGGTAPADYTPPAGDRHLEYTADEYLSLTNGAGLEEPIEVRRAGRTGSYGWTVRAGYPASE